MPALCVGFFFFCVCVRICVLVSAFDAALRFAIQGSGASCNPCLCAFHISFTFFFLTSLSLVYSVFFFFNSCTRPQLYHYDSLSFSFLFCSFLVTLKFFLLLLIVVCSTSYNRNTTVSCPHTHKKKKTATTTPAEQQQQKESLSRPFTPAVREVLGFYPLSLSLALCRSTIWLSVVEFLSDLRWQSKKEKEKKKKRVTRFLRCAAGSAVPVLVSCMHGTVAQTYWESVKQCEALRRSQVYRAESN